MTQLELIANYAEIAGGLAIIISLIYVGYQVRLSNRIARAENMRVILDLSLYDNYDLGSGGTVLDSGRKPGYSGQYRCLMPSREAVVSSPT